MHAAIVMPCLNEEAVLAKTCASLGFGIEKSITSTATLILVDNGSNDQTLREAEIIRANSEPGSVVIVHEPERGYVPPRRRGNVIAADLASRQNASRDDWLVIQADADTQYGEGYVEAMSAVAQSTSPNAFLKARTSYPNEFIRNHGGYVELCDKVDAEFEHLLSDDPDDVIIDDKACAYRLSRYFQWGQHQREFMDGGDEVFAETTRLYLRARSFDAHVVLVDDALACHSPRRVFQHAGLDLATSGFPREKSWSEHWSGVLAEIKSIDDLLAEANAAIVRTALRWRRRHIIGLFGVLPWHVHRSSGSRSNHASEPWAMALDLPMRDKRCLRATPGRLIEDTLSWMETAGP